MGRPARGGGQGLPVDAPGGTIGAMSDEQLRGRERAARGSESPADEAALLVSWRRVGTLKAATLELAAYLGHGAARVACGLEPWPLPSRMPGTARWLVPTERPSSESSPDERRRLLEVKRRLNRDRLVREACLRTLPEELRAVLTAAPTVGWPALDEALGQVRVRGGRPDTSRCEAFTDHQQRLELLERLPGTFDAEPGLLLVDDGPMFCVPFAVGRRALGRLIHPFGPARRLSVLTSDLRAGISLGGHLQATPPRDPTYGEFWLDLEWWGDSTEPPREGPIPVPSDRSWAGVHEALGAPELVAGATARMALSRPRDPDRSITVSFLGDGRASVCLRSLEFGLDEARAWRDDPTAGWNQGRPLFRWSETGTLCAADAARLHDELRRLAAGAPAWTAVEPVGADVLTECVVTLGQPGGSARSGTRAQATRCCELLHAAARRALPSSGRSQWTLDRLQRPLGLGAAVELHDGPPRTLRIFDVLDDQDVDVVQRLLATLAPEEPLVVDALRSRVVSDPLVLLSRRPGTRWLAQDLLRWQLARHGVPHGAIAPAP